MLLCLNMCLLRVIIFTLMGKELNNLKLESRRLMLLQLN